MIADCFYLHFPPFLGGGVSIPIVECLIMWERDLGAALEMTGTPSDKLVIPQVSVLVRAAKMSADFGEKHDWERGWAVI